ncbi:MAG TPA: hypothetical protein VFX59_27825 [Polyangiales bacterium]|nr:hypothetical protein [Polyangiales bacterium]
MKRPLLLLTLGGCVSDLAVGMSTDLIIVPDATVSEPPDAGRRDIDAGGDPPVVYVLDASFPRDAARDASHDAGPQWKLCPAGNCDLGFISIDSCGDARMPVCARPYPSYGCEFTCDVF